MNDTQKLTIARMLKIIFYLSGFPLLLLFVAKDSMIFFNEGTFSETAKSGITAVFLIWVAVTLVQGGLYLLMRRQRGLRTLITAVLSVTLLLAPVAGMDVRLSKRLDEVNAKYKDGYESGLPEYAKQKQWFNSLSDAHGYSWNINRDVNNFIRVYGLQDYYPAIKRSRSHASSDKVDYAPSYMMAGSKKISVKGKDVGKEFDKHLAESPYLYNENGLLYEGYIFGVQNALEQLMEYNGYLDKEVYRKLPANPEPVAEDLKGKKIYTYVTEEGAETGEYEKVESPDPDDWDDYYELIPVADALKSLVAEQAAATEGKWFDYTQTDAYKQYKAEETEYVITHARLDEILSTLFEYLGQDPALTQLVRGLSLGKILQILPALIKPDATNLKAGDIGNIVVQLLYGGSDGKGGETTGLALPGKYLFHTIRLSGKTRDSFFGEYNPETNRVENDDGDSLTLTQAKTRQVNGDSLYVYVMEYTVEDDNHTTNIKDDVLKPVLTCEKYSDAVGGSRPAVRYPDEFNPQENADHRGKRYYGDRFYFKEDLSAAFETYKNKLETDFTEPATAALVDLLRSLDPAIPLLGGLLSGDAVMGLVGGIMPGLDLAAVLNDVLDPAALNKVVADLMGGLDLSKLRLETVQGLLDGILSEVSFYYHPKLHTCWQPEYIPDADKALDTPDGEKINLGKYAENKYTCEQFGITGGCVLAVKPGGGLLTGKTLGAGAAASDAFGKDRLYKLAAEIEFAQEAYPLLAARRYMVIWAGVIVISVYMTMYYARKEEQLFLSLTKGGEEQ